MATSHQQAIADAGSDQRRPMLEKESYVPWVSHFRRYVDGKREHGRRVMDSIDNGPFRLKEITNPTSPTAAPRTKPQTYADLTGDDKLIYEADIDAMNWILLGIPNDIYNFAGESIESVYGRFCTLVNNMDRNNLTQSKIVLNTKFLNCLQPEWSKYNEPDVNASRAKRAARNHDPLALVANTYASPSSSRSLQQYYVIHPPSVQDYDNDYQSKSLGFAGSSSRNAGNQGRNVRNQGITTGNGFVLTTDGNAENVQRNLRTTANSGKAPIV
ncbi:hypothetical protein Tco_1414366 [Tanacetum coccineum]